MYNPYQKKLISDMIMNVLLTVLLVINMFPINIAARISAEEVDQGDPVQEVSGEQENVEGVDQNGDQDPSAVNTAVPDDSGKEEITEAENPEPSAVSPEGNSDQVTPDGNNDEDPVVADSEPGEVVSTDPEDPSQLQEDPSLEPEEEISLLAAASAGFDINIASAGTRINRNDDVTGTQYYGDSLELVYTFNNNGRPWYISDDDFNVSYSGSGVTANGSVSSGRTSITVNITFDEDNYSEATVTVNFKDSRRNGGSNQRSRTLYISIPEPGYTVRWVDYNDTLLEEDTLVAKGSTPSYDGEEPSRARDEQYTYTFSGWDPEISEVVGDATYVAQYTSAENSYTVVWKNGDVVLETDDEVEYGTIPSYDGEEPVKEKDQNYSYMFAGWNPEVKEATGAEDTITYEAVFTSIERRHKVEFEENADGVTNMPEPDVRYDEDDKEWYLYKPTEIPVLEGYTFTGWSLEHGTFTEAFPEERILVDGDMVIFAFWDENYEDAKVINIGDSNYFSRLRTYYVSGNGTETLGLGSRTLVSITKQSDGTYAAVFRGSLLGTTNTIYVSTEKADGEPYAVKVVSGAGSENNPYVLDVLFNYTVTFVDYDGTVISEETYPEGTRARLVEVPENPQREADEEYSYTFSGWDKQITTVNEDVVYTATYTEKQRTHNITFDPNAGEDVVDNMPSYANTAIIVGKEYFVEPKKMPEREGYDFDGWSTEPGTFEVFFDESVEGIGWIGKEADQDYTLYAIWYDVNGYVNITLDYNDGSSASSSENVRWDETLTYEGHLFNIDREGYDFLGWYTEADGGEKVTENTPIKNEDHVLYAHWQKQGFVLTFNERNRILFPTTVTKEVDLHETAVYGDLLYTPELSGYKFTGWYTAASGGTKVEADSEFVSQNDHTLYAHWDYVGTATVTLDKGYGSNSERYTRESVNRDSDLTYEKVLYTPEREGYDFLGWYTAADGGEEVVATDKLISTSNHTLYAHWQIKKFTITMMNGDKVYEELEVEYEQLPVVADPEKKPTEDFVYRFIGWTNDTESETPTGLKPATEDETYYAVYEEVANSFEVHFTVDGEAIVSLYNIKYGKTLGENKPTTDPLKPADQYKKYTFEGWALQDDEDDTILGDEYEITGDTYFKAVFAEEVIGYCVTFMVDDAVYEEVAVNAGATVEMPQNPEKEDHVFDAWTYENGTAFNPDTEIMEDLTLYARWSAVHVVTFIVDGREYSKEVVIHGETVHNIPATPEREGYVFDGWKLGDYDFDFNMPIVESLYVTASWTKKYTVRLMDGDFVYDIQTVNEGEKAVKPAQDPERKGHDFINWYLDEEVYDFDTPVTGDLELNAEFEIHVYTITYVLGNNGTLDNAKDEYTIEDDSFTLGHPSRPGYTFLWWTGTGIIGGNRNVTVNKGSVGDRTYTAVWWTNRQTPYTVKHYMQHVYDNEYDLLETEERYGRTDTTATVSGNSRYINYYMSHVNTEKSVLSGNIEGDGSLVLEIYYDKNDYTLTVNTDAGIEKVTANGVPVGKTTTYRAGNVLNIEATLKEGYTNSTPLTISISMTDDRTVTFRTRTIRYQIRYDLDGGSLPEGKSNPRRYNVESETFTLINPIKEGYTFKGWSLNGSEEIVEEVVIPKGSTGDRTYKANYEANTYYVRFVKPDDNIEGEMADQEFTYDKAQKLNKNEYRLWGHDFDKWQDGEDNFYEDEEEVINLSAEQDGIVELAPTWKLATFTGTFELAEGEQLEGERDNPFTYKIDEYDRETSEDPKFVIGNTASKTGHTFKGWDVYNADKTKKFNEEPTDVLEYDWKAEDIVLVPVFEANKYTLSFDLNKEIAEDAELVNVDPDFTMEVTYGEKVGAMPAAFSVTYHFMGWFDEQDDEYTAETVYEVADDTVLKADWLINASALDVVDENGIKVINNVPDDIPHGSVWNNLNEPVILNSQVESVIIPINDWGSAPVTSFNERLNGRSEYKHLYRVVNCDLNDYQKIDLIVIELEDEATRKTMIEAAKERGFTTATETNSLLFEAYVAIDGTKTEITQPMVITLNLPAGMANVPGGYNREFRVFHKLSNGSIVEEPVVSVDLANRLIRIEVDEFSPFVIVFRDKAKPSDSAYKLPTTGITIEDGSHTLRMMTLVAALALGTTMKAKNRLGRKYWEDLK